MPRGVKKYASYYEYVEKVVKKCSHNWIILTKNEFNEWRKDYYSGNIKELPKGTLVKIVPARCKSYSCPICGKKKVHDLANRIKHARLKGYRFFTLTLQSKGNLSDTEKNLLAISGYFKKLLDRLKKQKQYKDLQYFKVTEIGSKSGMVHLHGIFNKYIPVKDLSRHWLEITGNSWKVDIKRVKDQGDITRYMFKYMTKNVVSKDQDLVDPALFNMDLKNTASMFYELGKRRYSYSSKFFSGVEKTTGEYTPYYYEEIEGATVEHVLQKFVKEFKLKKDQIDLTLYYESDLFINNLFNSS